MDPSTGLSSSVVRDLRAVYGYNEFSVAPSVNLVQKFIETIYESPLNLLLLGSAFISAVMGNIDDAASITIALLIVLTGEQFLTLSFSLRPPKLTRFIFIQWVLCKNEGRSSHYKHLLVSYLIIVIYYGERSIPSWMSSRK